jgi:hypothetical protein
VAAGYRVKGEADAHMKFDQSAPDRRDLFSLHQKRDTVSGKLVNSARSAHVRRRREVGRRSD